MENQNVKNKKNYASFFEDGVYIYEHVFDNEEKQSFFLGFHRISNTVEEVKDEVLINDKSILPFNNDIVLKGIIKLASDAVDYGEEKYLIEVIQLFIHKYVDLPDFGEKIASYYVLLSWVYDNYESIPYLRFLGDYGTGKSRALKTIGNLCYKPIFAGGAITASPIFRLINDYHGTLVIDEADFSKSDYSADIVKILNCGYQKGLPVLRTEGSDNERQPKAFDVFSPKLLATRKEYTDLALESRCLTIHMEGNPRKDIPFNLPDEFEAEALTIRNKLLYFRFKYYGSDIIKIDEAKRIPNVESRINQIAMPLLSIVNDKEEQQKIIDFIVKYDKELKMKRVDELSAVILKAIIKLHSNGKRLFYKEIAQMLKDESDFQYGNYEIQPTKIGKLNHANLNFKTRRINGTVELLWDEQKAKTLCERYGFNYEDIINSKPDYVT